MKRNPCRMDYRAGPSSLEAKVRQRLAILISRVLVAAIRVMDTSWRRPPCFHRGL